MSKFQDLVEKARKGEPLGDTSITNEETWWTRHKGYTNEMHGATARMLRAMGDDPEKIEKEQKAKKAEKKAAQSQKPKRMHSQTARMLKSMTPQETLGGGHVTDVPLRDARGGSGMGASGEGEISPFAYESFDFSEAQTLAATKGIKGASQSNDNEYGKKLKMMKDPEGNERPDYKKLGAKDVNGADNLDKEAVSPEMKNSAYESIRVDHVTKGKGTVLEIAENHIEIDWDRSSLRILGPEKLPFSETKYLIRIKERYSDDPEDVDVDAEDEPKGNKKMAKKQKVDEAMVAIKPTMREMGDGYKLPVIDLSPEDIGMVLEYDLPDPGDSVLTGQDQGGTPKIEPLSTERGAEAAHNDVLPDGDFGKDLLPDDAPNTPTYDELGDDAGNPRSTDGTDNPAADVGGNSLGGSDDVKADSGKSGGKSGGKGYNFDKKDSDSDSDDSDDSEDDSDDDKDDEDEKVKESTISLTWEDVGLDISEVSGRMSDHDVTLEDETCEGCGDDMMGETHDTEGGEVGLTPGLLKNLLGAVRDQSPDDATMEAICGGIEEASREKGATLEEGDIGTIMGKIREAAQGGGAPEADPEVGGAPEAGEETPNSVGDESMAGGDVRGRQQGGRGRDSEGARDDEHGDAASKYQGKAWRHESEGEDEDEKYQEQDKAEGDGEEAGGEGGDEHEGKTKLMDKKGKDQDDDGDVDSDDWKIGRDKAIKKDKAAEGKGIKPVSANTSKGSGPGGGNVTNDGQDQLIPAVAKGSQRGTPGTPLSKEGGGRTVKPVSESMVAMGMAAIGGTVRNVESQEDDGLTEEQKELQMIRRRAGLEDWWKVD